jgi:cysteine desulfurase
VVLGLASTLALGEHTQRAARCQAIKEEAFAALETLGIVMNGDAARSDPHTLNFSLLGVDSEAAIVALKDVAARSNGSACRTQSCEPSHVLTAARLPEDQIAGAQRLSWSHGTASVDWNEVSGRLQRLRAHTG